MTRNSLEDLNNHLFEQLERLNDDSLSQEEMSDLIDRQSVFDAMAELQGRAETKAELKGISKAWKRITKLPSAEPERKKGKWIIYGDVDWRGRNTGKKKLVCDQCHEERILEYGGKIPNFCAHCGADMR